MTEKNGSSEVHRAFKAKILQQRKLTLVNFQSNQNKTTKVKNDETKMRWDEDEMKLKDLTKTTRLL